jgi:hypothetical protein
MEYAVLLGFLGLPPVSRTIRLEGVRRHPPRRTGIGDLAEELVGLGRR